MSEKNGSFRVQWSVDDGYAGGARPHWFEISAEEVLDFGDADEAMNYIGGDRLEEEFRDRLSPVLDHESRVRAWVVSVLSRRDTEAKS